ERPEMSEFAHLFRPESLEFRQISGQLFLARDETRLEPCDLVDQEAVVERDQVQVLVPVEQVPEALGAEEDLDGVERPALVDGAEPATEHDAPLGQAVTAVDQLAGRLLDAPGERGGLELDLPEHGDGGRDLALDVGE